MSRVTNDGSNWRCSLRHLVSRSIKDGREQRYHVFPVPVFSIIPGKTTPVQREFVWTAHQTTSPKHVRRAVSCERRRNCTYVQKRPFRFAREFNSVVCIAGVAVDMYGRCGTQWDSSARWASGGSCAGADYSPAPCGWE